MPSGICVPDNMLSQASRLSDGTDPENVVLNKLNLFTCVPDSVMNADRRDRANGWLANAS
ncbi:hypothetical protein D3C85_1616790 [compost metagenome]